MEQIELDPLVNAIQPLDEAAMAGDQHQGRLATKPPGLLGRLEDLSIWLAGVRGEGPSADNDEGHRDGSGRSWSCAAGCERVPREVTRVNGAQLPERREQRSTCWLAVRARASSSSTPG